MSNPTKTFTINANPDMMLKIERFLAWLHYNSAWGHSATIAIDSDGDGSDEVTVIENVSGTGELYSIQEHREYVKIFRPSVIVPDVELQTP